jgi:CRP/FNR family cyclic AMP-dependent transcriptional regulator
MAHISPKRKALSRIPVFQGLEPQELSHIERFLFSLEVKPKSHLLKGGEMSDWIYFIAEGTVCIFQRYNDGPKIIINIVGSGEILGEICAVDQQVHSAHAVATETTTLYKMQRQDFMALRKSLPVLSENVIHLITQRLRFSTTHILSLAERKVQLRVSRLLRALADRYATQAGQNIVTIPLRLTQIEIAHWARVSRQHARMHLDALKENGIIEMTAGNKHRVTIRDYERLSQHCDCPSRTQ